MAKLPVMIRIAVCLLVSLSAPLAACQVRPTPEPLEIEMGLITVEPVASDDEQILLNVDWYVGGTTDEAFAREHLHVMLFNGGRNLDVTPSTVRVTDDRVLFEGQVELSRLEWSRGCWQAIYREQPPGSLEVVCLNEESAFHP